MSETIRIDAKNDPEKRAGSARSANSTTLHESPQSPALKIIGIQQAAGNGAMQRMLKAGRLPATKENRTGLPDNLRTGIESLSGMDLGEVRVHYHSEKPAGIGAHAYTRGTDIHVAPGQEAHLPHEAWHVVQQAQGRVRPTFQLKDAVVNDDAGLEAEADTMGKRALQISRYPGGDPDTYIHQSLLNSGYSIPVIVQRQGSIIQAVWIQTDTTGVLKWNVRISGVRWYTDGVYYWFVIESKEGEKFSKFAEKKLSHEEWKKHGAKDLPEGDIHFAAMYNMMPPDRQGMLPKEGGELSPVGEKQSVLWGQSTMIRHYEEKGKSKIDVRGPPRKYPFYNWLFGKTEKPSQMNCYEAVFYTAVLAGIRDKEYVKNMLVLEDPQIGSEINENELAPTMSSPAFIRIIKSQIGFNSVTNESNDVEKIIQSIVKKRK